MDDKQLAKLIRKNLAKAAQGSKAHPRKSYDPTLQNRSEDDADVEREHLFKEMRRREF
ncbi:MAG TPA: hypothetical protein VFY16_12745 [Gemmatimonadaceae bacterium]|nr:hypothetical protein [Gemmatimonadaceae bacterium]